MTDLTKGKKFCRVSQTWLEPKEHARRYADYEERVFQKQPSQGELCAPMLLRDGMDTIQSMTNGKYYDSKSELRKEYRRAGVVEVGNECNELRAMPGKKRKEVNERREKEVRAAVETSLSQAGFGAV